MAEDASHAAHDKTAVMEAVLAFDLRRNAGAWKELELLSDETELDGIHVDPAGVIFDNDRFKGLLNVYVVLRYDEHEGQEGFVTSDAFLGFFEGHIACGGRPVVDELTIDTSPFYE